MNQPPRPLLLGHRGARPARYRTLGWRKSGIPAENSLEAFAYAMANGCDGVEFDVRCTRDQRLVLCHDPELKGQAVAATELQSMSQLLGYAPPCLEDVLERFAGSAYLDIELKVTGMEEATIAALRANPPARGHIVSSFLPEVLLRLHELDPLLPLGYISRDRHVADGWRELPITTFVAHHSLVSQPLVRELHARGVKLLTWTVNDGRELLRLATWGVDGLISDDPKLLSDTFPYPAAVPLTLPLSPSRQTPSLAD